MRPFELPPHLPYSLSVIYIPATGHYAIGGFLDFYPQTYTLAEVEKILAEHAEDPWGCAKKYEQYERWKSPSLVSLDDLDI